MRHIIYLFLVAVFILGATPAFAAEVDGTREEIIETATEYCGETPYMFGGTDLNTGTDCSGFITSVYAECGVLDEEDVEIHAYNTAAFMEMGEEVTEEDIQPGDILCYEDHVAIYMDETHIIHVNGKNGAEITECDPFTYHGGALAIRSLI